MTNHDFTLKSGAKLHISPAPFEAAMDLYCVAKDVAIQKGHQADIALLLSNPEVRKALYKVFDLVTYESVRVTPSLFDDRLLGERACGDYFEMALNVIEVNNQRFFLKTSSPSTEALNQTTKSQE